MITILLVDDHRIIREGLRSVLERESDFEVVAEAANGNDAFELARSMSPDVVIMDVVMPDTNGIDAAMKIRNLAQKTRIVALTMHSDKNYLKGMLKAGVMGYLLKDCASEELVHAVRDVVNGKAYISSEVTAVLLEDYSGNLAKTSDESAESKLNPREIEVLQFIATGMSTKDMAEELSVSIKTIDRYKAHLMEKLGIFTVAELTKYAVRIGISSLD